MKRASPMFVLLAALAIGVGACGGSQPSAEVDPMVTALHRADQLIGEAIEQGHEAEEEQERVEFVARFNPAAECDCPDWEIVYRGRWMRVFVEAVPEDQPMLDEMTQLAEQHVEEGLFMTYRLPGRLEGEPVLVEQTGMRYRTLKLAWMGADSVEDLP